jgi:hypothetical protein
VCHFEYVPHKSSLIKSQGALAFDLFPKQEAQAGLSPRVQGLGTGALRSALPVTVAAGRLQKAGLISYLRGSVAISDRKGLEEASCDCYALVKKQLEDWRREANGKTR